MMRLSAIVYYGLVIPFLSVLCAACCMANYKCSGDQYDEIYRLQSAAGNNLLFGPGRVYDPARVTVYSLNGTDTVFYRIGFGPYPQPGQDSVLFVNYDIRKFERAFIRWSATDTDTLSLSYQTIDAGPCCPDYASVVTATYNNALPGKGMNGIVLLNK